MSKIYVDEIAGIASADTVAIPGHVIQVVSATDGTDTNITTSATWTDTGLSASITPASVNSRVYINVNLAMQVQGNTSGDGDTFWGAGRIQRNGTALWTPSSSTLELGYNTRDGATGVEGAMRATWIYVDSPSSTASVTYNIQAYLREGNGIYLNSRDTISTITLMEIAG